MWSTSPHHSCSRTTPGPPLPDSGVTMYPGAVPPFAANLIISPRIASSNGTTARAPRARIGFRRRIRFDGQRRRDGFRVPLLVQFVDHPPYPLADRPHVFGIGRGQQDPVAVPTLGSYEVGGAELLAEAPWKRPVHRPLHAERQHLHGAVSPLRPPVLPGVDEREIRDVRKPRCRIRQRLP